MEQKKSIEITLSPKELKCALLEYILKDPFAGGDVESYELHHMRFSESSDKDLTERVTATLSFRAVNTPLPFLAVGNEELAKAENAYKGDYIRCPKCSGEHQLKCGKDSKTGEESRMLLFYNCGADSYLAAIQGKLLGEIKKVAE